MRRTIVSLLASTASLAVLSSAAFAADLPARRAAPAPYVAVPVFTWTGFYVGVNAGYGFTDSNRNFTGDNLTAPAFGGGTVPVARAGGDGFFNNGRGGNRDGFVGGGQVGYNYQFTPGSGFVVGIEADIQYTDFGRSRNGQSGGAFGEAVPGGNVGGGIAAAGFGIAPTGTGTTPPGFNAGAPGNVAFFNNAQTNDISRSDFFGTVRGRVGYAFDRFLVFGTGGVAFKDSGSNNRRTFGFANGASVTAPFYTFPDAAVAGSTVVPTGNFDRRRNNDVGYAVGGGVEYAFTPSLSGKIEGLYVNFDNGNNRTGTGVVGVTNNGAPITRTATAGRDSGNDFAVVRAGLNYRFNGF